MAKQPANRIPPKTVDTLFDIPKSALIPIVEHATQAGPIVDLEIKLTHEKQGHKGEASESVIVTFYYQTEASTTGDIIIFVKRQLSPNKRETEDYLAFAQVGIPTPKYYGHLIGGQGEEILFLEFLPDIGIDPQNALEVRAWVGLLAQISATELPFAHFSIPDVPPDEKQTSDLAWWGPSLKQIWEKGAPGGLGLAIQALCRENPHGVAMLTEYGVRVETRVAQMGKALHQGDASSQNVGWRITENEKEVVVFDLGFDVGQRFYDIGNVMRSLRECVMSHEEIAAHFVAEYAKWGGARITLAEFLEEVAWISDIIEFWTLPWFLDMSQSGKVDWTDDIEAGKTTFRHWLHEGLKQLLESASIGKPLGARNGI